MSFDHILVGNGGRPVYVNETGDREEVLATVYLNETVEAVGGFVPAWALQSNSVIIGGVQA